MTAHATARAGRDHVMGCLRAIGAALPAAPVFIRLLFAVIPDAIEGAGQIVRNQKRAVPELRDIDGTPEIFAVLVEPTFSEGLGFARRAVLLEDSRHQARANRYGAIPGAVLSGKDRVLVFLREHPPGVKGHAEIRRVRDHLDLWEDHVGGRRLVLVFVGTGAASAVIRETEVLAGLDGAVELTRRNVVAHAVHLIVAEPERLVLRIEVHADRVADACRVDLAVLSVAIHPDDPADAPLLVEVGLLWRRYVERLAERDVELRSE